MKTRKSIEREVLQAIAERGGFTVFWATENLARARTIDRLSADGKIRRSKDIGQFPWCRYEVVDEATTTNDSEAGV